MITQPHPAQPDAHTAPAVAGTLVQHKSRCLLLRTVPPSGNLTAALASALTRSETFLVVGC